MMTVLQQADIQRIYLHDYAAVEVPTLNRLEGSMAHCFAERAVVMAQRGDLVVTIDAMDPDYLRYLDHIGLGPGTNAIMALNANNDPQSRSLLARLVDDELALARITERIDRSRRVVLNPYFASRPLENVRAKFAHLLRSRVTLETDVAAAEIANRKDTVRNAAIALGVPTSIGEVCRFDDDAGASIDGTLEDVVTRYLGATGSVIVRAAWSMHGVDNLIVDDRALSAGRVRDWVARRSHIRTYLVEVRVPLLSSPNVQLYVAPDGSVTHLATTKQRLDSHFSYLGSEHPHVSAIEHDLARSASAVTTWLSSVGYRGFLGIDFIETIDQATGQPSHLLAEVNGRINGATYGLALAGRLNQVRQSQAVRPASQLCWSTNAALHVSARSFVELADAIGDLLYVDAGQSRGVVPYTIGLLRFGGVHAAILAETVDEAKALERELLARIDQRHRALTA